MMMVVVVMLSLYFLLAFGGRDSAPHKGRERKRN
jgi:hypothetical protein